MESIRMLIVHGLRAYCSLLCIVIVGNLWWRMRFWFAERRLAQALDCYGDQALEVRRAHAEWLQMDFAVRFGCSASPHLGKVILAAHKHGAKANDLGMMLLNGDIRRVGARVVVKQGSWMPFLLTVPNGVFLCALTALSLLPVAAPLLTCWEKVVTVALLIPPHVCLWRIWFIVDVRIPLARLRSSRAISMAIEDVEPATILTMPSLR